jgi:hypothetical protein
MKHLSTLVILSILILNATKAFTQTVVTGHVFAEVVESVCASTYSQTSITIQRNHTEGIDFGKIEIKSTESAMCSLILSRANLTGNNMEHISMETSVANFQDMQENAINGSQSISLQCLPDKHMVDQTASSYMGDINIVLAYN